MMLVIPPTPARRLIGGSTKRHRHDDPASGRAGAAQGQLPGFCPRGLPGRAAVALGERRRSQSWYAGRKVREIRHLWHPSDMVAETSYDIPEAQLAETWATIVPPKDVIETLLYRGDWDFPTVRGIVNSPTMRPDGSLLTTPGYDVATELWYKPAGDLELPPTPERPTKTEAEAALKLLTNLLAGFPFETDVDRSVALAASLTLVLRGAFEIAPLFLFLAPELGTGKTYLVFVISTSLLDGGLCRFLRPMKPRRCKSGWRPPQWRPSQSCF